MLPPSSKVKGTERDTLVLPTAVVGSFRGAMTISFTALLPWSATRIFPSPSTATPVGPLKPLPSVFTTELEETKPPTATIYFTALLL